MFYFLQKYFFYDKIVHPFFMTKNFSLSGTFPWHMLACWPATGWHGRGTCQTGQSIKSRDMWLTIKTDEQTVQVSSRCLLGYSQILCTPFVCFWHYFVVFGKCFWRDYDFLTRNDHWYFINIFHQTIQCHRIKE